MGDRERDRRPEGIEAAEEQHVRRDHQRERDHRGDQDRHVRRRASVFRACPASWGSGGWWRASRCAVRGRASRCSPPRPRPPARASPRPTCITSETQAGLNPSTTPSTGFSRNVAGERRLRAVGSRYHRQRHQRDRRDARRRGSARPPPPATISRLRSIASKPQVRRQVRGRLDAGVCDRRDHPRVDRILERWCRRRDPARPSAPKRRTR